MRRVLIYVLRRLESTFLRASIPIHHFGWDGDSESGVWRWPERERGLFYAHNRRQSRLACSMRDLAGYLDGALGGWHDNEGFHYSSPTRFVRALHRFRRWREGEK
jgi:hypothetical protein